LKNVQTIPDFVGGKVPCPAVLKPRAECHKTIKVNILRKRALCVPQKSPMCSAKESHIVRQRASYVPTKSPIRCAKEPYIFRKSALPCLLKPRAGCNKSIKVHGFRTRSLIFRKKAPHFPRNITHIPQKCPLVPKLRCLIVFVEVLWGGYD